MDKAIIGIVAISSIVVIVKILIKSIDIMEIARETEETMREFQGLDGANS